MALLITLLALSVPHILYYYVWTRPKKWASLVGPTPCEIFAQVAGFLKLFQFAVVVWWYFQTKSAKASFELPNTLVLLVSLGLIGFGQALNAGIYRAIGKEGVYYGCKFGKNVPWYSGFPFTVVRHPQYVGSVLTIWGVYFLTCLHASVLVPGLVVAAAWSAMYAASSYVESHL